MLPISAKPLQRLEIRPDDGPVQAVYFVKPATLLERSAWRRAVYAQGAQYASDLDLLEALRREVEALGLANAESLLARIDEVATLDAAERGKAMATLEPIAGPIRRAGGEFAALEAQRTYWAEVAPAIAAARFLRAREIDGKSVSFPRQGDEVASEELEALPETHVYAIGWYAISLMRLSEAAEKNSASPSPSQQTPLPSETASESIDAPPMDPAG